MAELNKETQEDLAQLQVLQQRIQLLVSQKQVLQQRVNEIDDALKEIKESKKPIYKLVGEALIEKDKKELEEELKKEKETINIRIQSLETQEKKNQEKTKELQERITKDLKNG
ncbi:MAG: prefoldin subunit beta [Clostridiales bacterium]|nr:prefoldin subunit beta [Clostridiales bacterium]